MHMFFKKHIISAVLIIILLLCLSGCRPQTQKVDPQITTYSVVFDYGDRQEQYFLKSNQPCGYLVEENPHLLVFEEHGDYWYFEWEHPLWTVRGTQVTKEMIITELKFSTILYLPDDAIFKLNSNRTKNLEDN